MRDVHNDIKTVALTSTGTSVEIVMSPVLERIQQSKFYYPNAGFNYCILYIIKSTLNLATGKLELLIKDR